MRTRDLGCSLAWLARFGKVDRLHGLKQDMPQNASLQKHADMLRIGLVHASRLLLLLRVERSEAASSSAEKFLICQDERVQDCFRHLGINVERLAC